MLRTALAIATAAALALGGCNVVEMRRDGFLQRLAEAGLTMERVTLGDDTLRYWSGGARDRPTVLLVHGFGGGALWQWAATAEALAADGYRVVMPDLLWFGGSSSQRADYSLEHQVAALRALLEYLGEDGVHVVGVSYGGLVAWELAVLDPARVESLTVIGAPARLLTDADRAAGLARLGVGSYSELLLPEDVADVERLLALAYADPPWAPDWALAQVPAGMYAAWRTEQSALLEAIHGPGHPVHDDRGSVRAPTMLVWGSHDPLYPLAFGRRLRDAVAHDARCLVIFAPGGHAPLLEYPETFNALLRNFLARHAD